MIAHRFIEVYRRAAGRIKASQPHGTDKDNPQRILGVFELFVEFWLRFIDAAPMWLDVEPVRAHLGDFVLAR